MATKVTKAEAALGVLVKHPGWTDRAIAKRVGCSRQWLWMIPEFKRARAIQRACRGDLYDRHVKSAQNAEADDSEGV